MIRTERSSFIPALVAVRYTLPPRLRRGTRHTGAPPFLASLRRAPVRHPEGASGRCSLAARSHGPRKAPERVGSPAGAQEGVHRHAPVARLRESPRLSEAHVRKTRPHPHSTPARKGGIVRSDIRVPEAKRGRVPCRNEDEYRFPCGTVQNLEWNKRAQKRRRLPHGRRRLFR